ncbi:hypothetical protein OG225_12920 [Nocardia sp. NBC_01377]|uniref:hypothetical protein n=1 Tax=Nocardia sp. NBC_01377 TaxID=2903595 RepID=UPI0032475206
MTEQGDQRCRQVGPRSMMSSGTSIPASIIPATIMRVNAIGATIFTLIPAFLPTWARPRPSPSTAAFAVP